jgi:ABC-2 type transport system ATP-binding protein
METVIQTTNLTKFYGKSRGIENVNINVNKGDIYGFLGPNGSGKSTTIRTLLDLIRPTGGSASIFGLDCQKDAVAVKKRIGYVPGDVSLYGFMTAEKFMAYFGGVRGRYDAATAKKYADRFDIRLDRKLKEYSKGNRQKIALIQAFINNPELVIMDEPTSGLDPLIQQTFLDLLMEEAANGRTIFMSSHVLFEVEKACNRVAIIKDGNIVAQEKVEDLQKKSGRLIDVKFNEQVDPDTFKMEGVSRIAKHNGSIRMTVSGNVRNVLKEIASHDVAEISIHQMSLEDIFLQYYSGGK